MGPNIPSIILLLLLAAVARVSALATLEDCKAFVGNETSQECWNTLNMKKYISDWYRTHSASCIAKGQTFSRCFMLSINMGSVDCSDITYASCPPPAYLDYKRENIPIEDYYVAYSIYSLWQFFNSYYLAMGNANTLASENIASIVDLLDPIKKSGSSMNDIFQALSSGLAFTTPFLGPVGAGIATGINQVPVLGNYLFPQQTLDTQFQQFGTLSGSLGDVTLQIQKNIAATLHEIEANFDFFLAFAGDGGFSVASIPSMHDQSTNMLSTFNAFVVP